MRGSLKQQQFAAAAQGATCRSHLKVATGCSQIRAQQIESYFDGSPAFLRDGSMNDLNVRLPARWVEERVIHLAFALCWLTVAAILFVGDGIVGAQDADSPPQGKTAGSKKDIYGDPLFIGASMRLGTIRYRHEGWLRQIEFLSDNETVVVGLFSGQQAIGKRPCRQHDSDLGPLVIDLPTREPVAFWSRDGRR